ncbi:MAG: ribonuclease R [Prevotellaceae bacterium]|jgi:ribonuclease R|nr:ribonuclease R [Prevotellaceae bacterium]
MIKKKFKNTKPQRQKKGDLINKVLEIMRTNPHEPLNYKQLAARIGLKTTPEKQLLIAALDELHLREDIIEVDKGKYKLNMRGGLVEGIIERHSNGKSYLIPDDGAAPVFIAERRLRQAMNNDRVRVFLYAKRPGSEPEGEVTEILKRAREEFVGILQVGHNYAFLRVDNKILTNDIFIPADKLKGGKNGQKAIARIVEWNPQDRNPVGEVIDVLGDTGDNNTEMHAILAEFGLPYKYPEAVERAADEIADDTTTADEIAQRIDMRNTVTFTIDPRDAKDFDDALSIKPLENGLWEVGVHIADVTHYVKTDSIIEQEAEKRATSIYLVDRTIPMLPERLSNELCSLRPNEDKLCFSVIFQIDEFGDVKNYEICRTVIRSNRRFTYEEAQLIIETEEGDFKDEILKLNELAKILRTRRFAKGAIAFERVEVRFEIDDKGKPLSVFFKEAKDSNKLIEEFMLLANRTVATHIGKPDKKGTKPKTFVYRIHDEPNPDKLRVFSDFIRKFGYKLKVTGKKSEISSSINHLLDEVQGHKEQNLIETIAIRSMAKAVYSTTNVGHYGLGFEYYTHFTSPIRRYPDMMVHRLLERYLAGGRSVNQQEYEEKCEHSSNMEQIAANAERASIKYKQVEFMADKIGMVYDGVISGITEWGIYVELNENKCEGMIPIRTLDDDYYLFDEKNYCLIGRHSHRKFQLGDDITVKIVKANLEKKQLDFKLM